MLEDKVPAGFESFMPPGRGPFTAPEVAKAFGWTPVMVHDHCKSGRILSIGEGKARRISRQAIISYLQAEAAKH